MEGLRRRSFRDIQQSSLQPTPTADPLAMSTLGAPQRPPMVPSKASPQVPNPSPAASGKRLAGAAANVVAGTKRRAAPGVEEDPNADGAVDPDTLIDPDMGHDGGEEQIG